MAHLHTDMERLDVHVALELCEIVIESATIVAIDSFAPARSAVRPARLSRSIPIGSILESGPARLSQIDILEGSADRILADA
jgi:hypothetical protein